VQPSTSVGEIHNAKRPPDKEGRQGTKSGERRNWNGKHRHGADDNSGQAVGVMGRENIKGENHDYRVRDLEFSGLSLPAATGTYRRWGNCAGGFRRETELTKFHLTHKRDELGAAPGDVDGGSPNCSRTPKAYMGPKEGDDPRDTRKKGKETNSPRSGGPKKKKRKRIERWKIAESVNPAKEFLCGLDYPQGRDSEVFRGDRNDGGIAKGSRKEASPRRKRQNIPPPGKRRAHTARKKRNKTSPQWRS